MAYYEFIGSDPSDPTTHNNYMGVRFTRGKPVKVEDPDMIRKLEGNSHFRKVDGRKAPPKPGIVATLSGMVSNGDGR